MSPTNGMGPLPEDDMIPVQISDTVTRGTVKPTYPVIQYPHNRDAGGDAIANGFIYRGTLIPALKDKLVFGDITTGRVWYANRADVLAADDGNPTTVAPIHEMDADLRRLTEEKFRERGGQGEALPGMGMVAGRGRVDLRFAVDNDGELYILTKSDGMIRKVVGARAATATSPRRDVLPRRVPAQNVSSVASREPEKSSGLHARVDRGREAGLRRQLRRLPRQPGAGRGQGRHHALHHRGAARQAAAGSHRRSMGPRLERRRRSSPSSSAACRRP